MRACVLTGALTLAALLSSPAMAAGDPDSIDTTTTVTTGLHVGAIDEDAAARAGTRVIIDGPDRVLIDGSTGDEIARIPAGNAEAYTEAARPRNTVAGNCGSSYFYMRDKPGTRPDEFWTGFEINGTAYDFD